MIEFKIPIFIPTEFNEHPLNMIYVDDYTSLSYNERSKLYVASVYNRQGWRQGSLIVAGSSCIPFNPKIGFDTFWNEYKWRFGLNKEEILRKIYYNWSVHTNIRMLSQDKELQLKAKLYMLLNK